MVYTNTTFWKFVHLWFCRDLFEQLLQWFLKFSGFKFYQFSRKIREIMSTRHRTAKSHSTTPPEKKMILITTLSKKLNLRNQIQTQLKIHNEIHCKTQNLLILRELLEKYKTPMCRIAAKNLWVFLTRTNPSRKGTFTITTSTMNRSCQLFFSTKTRTGTCSVDTVNESIWYWNQKLKNCSGKKPIDTFNFKKTPPQQIARLQFSNPTRFVLHVFTERPKWAIITDAFSFTEKHMFRSTKSPLFKKHCNDEYSIPPIRDHQDSYLHYLYWKTFESSFADKPLTLFLT